MLGALLLCTIPYETVTRDTVDLLEVNHVCDYWGDESFCQFIAWDYDYRACRFVVRGWRMVKSPAQRIQIDHGREDAFMLWHDGQTLREVRAGAWRETWEQYDPEMADRELLPKEHRRELSK